MATLPQIHYELRPFRSDYDLCEVNQAGTVVRRVAEIYDSETAERIAEALGATILSEPERAALPA